MLPVSELHNRIYDALCGVHPRRYPWHFQWLSTRHLYADLRRVLPELSGRVLDVGSRDKPYAPFLTAADEHVGLDLEPGPGVDHVVGEGGDWPFPVGSFDGVLCTQVLMYVPSPRAIWAEIDRVLRPGGRVVMTVPFTYQIHALIPDYWRFSSEGVRRLVPSGYEILELRRQGGAGSTIGNLVLGWLHAELHAHAITRTIKGLAMPLWMVFCLFVNVGGWLVDLLDTTESFYHNVLIVARKPGSPA